MREPSARLHYPYFPAAFDYRVVRTNFKAAAATVAQFRENQNLATNYRQGANPADLRALFAGRAQILANHRNYRGYHLALGYLRMEKEMAVGFLDIAIQQPDSLAQVQGQIGATVVLPVPPLPLATLMIILLHLTP